MAVFLPVRSEGKTVFDGKSNLSQQKHSTPIASQQRAPGRTACLAGATQQLLRHAVRPGIPLLGALNVATAKYPG